MFTIVGDNVVGEYAIYEEGFIFMYLLYMIYEEKNMGMLEEQSREYKDPNIDAN